MERVLRLACTGKRNNKLPSQRRIGSFMNGLRHAGTVLLALLILLGVPVFRTSYIQKKMSGVDAVSSASVIIDQPSGAYVVLINRDRHPNTENLATWEAFFRGEEIGFLFEDISCVVADTDAAGLELARSFQSRLPENQMKVRTEDMTLMLSKAQHGIYDVMVFSREFYDACGAENDVRETGADRIEAEGV